VGKAEGLGGDPLEDVIDDRVHDAHEQCCGCGSESRFYLIRIRIPILIVYTVQYLFFQCSGSVTYSYGSGPADPYH
jgi:hypothetical protein